MRNRLTSDRGAAAMFIVLMMSVAVAIPMMYQVVQGSRAKTRGYLNTTAQADNVARTGLDEALAWFRRRGEVRSVGTGHAFPDQAFDPGSPDTLDADIGLVQEFPLSSQWNLWGRFEVKKQRADNLADAALTDPEAAHDITGQYMGAQGFTAGQGMCWSVESRGILFKPKGPVTPGTAYNPSGEEIVARSRVFSEIRRLAPAPPADAAVITNRWEDLWHNGTNIRLSVEPGGVAFAYHQPPSGTATPNHFRDHIVPGVPSDQKEQVIGAGSLSVTRVFGTDLGSLKGLADLYVPGSSLPADAGAYPDYGLIVVEGDALFDAGHPFPASGVLVVAGNLTKPANVPMTFSGLVYVTGNVQLDGPGHLSGTLLSEGQVRLRGDYHPLEISQSGRSSSFARSAMGDYRQDRSVTFVRRDP